MVSIVNQCHINLAFKYKVMNFIFMDILAKYGIYDSLNV